MNPFLVFDLETQRSADEVGGWGNIQSMLYSVAVVWDSEKNDFFTYYENQFEDLFKHLTCGFTVVGFNHAYFDYKVLSGYGKSVEERNSILNSLLKQKNLDILLYIKEKLGFRLRLDGVARATLKTGKSADGLDALKWYKEYKETGDKKNLQMIADYCTQDVQVTRDLYLYGKKNKFIYYETKSRNLEKINVDWESSDSLEAEKTDKGSVFHRKQQSLLVLKFFLFQI